MPRNPRSTIRTAGARDKRGCSVAAVATGGVDLARPAAIVLPHDMANAWSAVAGDDQARPRLRARAAARVVDPLGRREGGATVGAGREEDVVVAETVVLPGDEQVTAVRCEGRMPLIARRLGVGVEAEARIVELAGGSEGRAAVGAARIEDVGVGLAGAEIRPDCVKGAVASGRQRRPLVEALEAGEVVDPDVRGPGRAPIVAVGREDVPVVVAEIRPDRVHRLARDRERRRPLVVVVERQVDGRAGIDADGGIEAASAGAPPRGVHVLECLALRAVVALVDPGDERAPRHRNDARDPLARAVGLVHAYIP